MKTLLLTVFMLAIIPACSPSSTNPDNPQLNDAGLPESLVIVQPDSNIPSSLKNLSGVFEGRYKSGMYVGHSGVSIRSYKSGRHVAVAVTKITSKTATVIYAWGDTRPGFVQVTATVINGSIKAVWYGQRGVDDYQSQHTV